MKHLAAVMLVLAFVATPFALAENEAKEAPVKDAGKSADPDAKAKPATPLAKLLAELTAIIAREKAKPEYSKSLIANLEALIKIYSRQQKPVSLADLSEADRKRLEEEVRAKMEKERENRGGDGGGDWKERAASRVLEGAYEDVKVTEKEREKTDPIITELANEAVPAQLRGDYKVVKDLKKDAERRLKKIVGNKRTRDIMNNLNRLMGRRRGWGR